VTLISAFGNSVRRVQVYVALDGIKNVTEVADSLSIQQTHASREIKWLKKKGLIDLAEGTGQGSVYQKTIFDSIINLSDALAKKFKLDSQGRRLK
jgi:predicted transcriptional regulator